MSKNTTLSKLIVFAAGAIVGSAATWKLLETRYEQRLQEDTKSIREAFENAPTFEVDDEPEDEVQVSNKEKQEYGELINESGYVNYSDHNTIMKEKTNVEKPYVIEPDEFGECDYRTISLTYYKDEILADDLDNIIDDVDDVVGLDSLGTFGMYEEDTVFVRNDAKKCDYEICRDERTYSDVTGISPHQMED